MCVIAGVSVYFHQIRYEQPHQLKEHFERSVPLFFALFYGVSNFSHISRKIFNIHEVYNEKRNFNIKLF